MPVVGADRGRTIVRMLQMVDLLRCRSMSARALAREFGVSRRTALRDLALLSKSGVVNVHRREVTAIDVRSSVTVEALD